MPVGSSASPGVTESWGCLQHGKPRSFPVKRWRLGGPGRPSALTTAASFRPGHQPRMPGVGPGGRPSAGGSDSLQLAVGLWASLLSPGPGCPYPQNGRIRPRELQSPSSSKVGVPLITLCTRPSCTGSGELVARDRPHTHTDARRLHNAWGGGTGLDPASPPPLQGAASCMEPLPAPTETFPPPTHEIPAAGRSQERVSGPRLPSGLLASPAAATVLPAVAQRGPAPSSPRPAPLCFMGSSVTKDALCALPGNKQRLGGTPHLRPFSGQTRRGGSRGGSVRSRWRPEPREQNQSQAARAPGGRRSGRRSGSGTRPQRRRHGGRASLS